MVGSKASVMVIKNVVLIKTWELATSLVVQANSTVLSVKETILKSEITGGVVSGGNGDEVGSLDVGVGVGVEVGELVGEIVGVEVGEGVGVCSCPDANVPVNWL